MAPLPWRLNARQQCTRRSGPIRRPRVLSWETTWLKHAIGPRSAATDDRMTCNNGPARATYKSGFGGNGGFRQNVRAKLHFDGRSGVGYQPRIRADAAYPTICLSDGADF